MPVKTKEELEAVIQDFEFNLWDVKRILDYSRARHGITDRVSIPGTVREMLEELGF